MMIVKCELFQDIVYILSADGDVWTVRLDEDRLPIWQKLGYIDRDKISDVCEPQLAKMFADKRYYPI